MNTWRKSMDQSSTLLFSNGPSVAIQLFIRAFVLVACLTVSLSWLVHAQPSASKRVLVLYWYNKDYPWNVKFDEGFQSALQSKSATRVEYYSEYLESNRFPGENQSLLFRDYLKQKYADRSIDLVVAASDASLDFLSDYRRELFPQSPIVFIATRYPSTRELADGAGLTGIVNLSAHQRTLDLALKLSPATQHVYIVSGTLEHDHRLETLARNQLRNIENRVQISYLTDLPLHDLIAQVKSLPEHSIVLYVWQQLQNADGAVLESSDIFASVAASTNAPIYGMTMPLVGSGIVGGYVNTAGDTGTKAAEITLQIVNGTKPQEIPIETAPAVPMFDWHQLQRWNISEDKLPPGSIVFFKQVSQWEQNKWSILGAFALIVGQAGLITWLLAERRRRRQSEKALRHLAAIVESSNDAIIGTTVNGNILSWNTGAELLYGYTAGEVVGRHVSCVVPPERKEEFDESLKRRARGERIDNFETIQVKKDETRIHVSVSVSPIKDDRGRVIADATITRDVSERKQKDEALRESEERFRNMADTAPVLIWMSGPDKQCTYFNRAWLGFTGRSIDKELGDGWTSGVHPHDLDRCRDTYMRAFDARRDFTIEFHLRRFDGEFRRVLDTGVPRFTPDGSFIGYIGSAIDITDLKRAEHELQHLTGRLIHLQDEERRRIAAELHDSLGQSLVIIKNRAMICLRESTSAECVLQQVEEISSTATSAIDEVHEIAHNLRPYELDRLGLVKAVETMVGKLENSTPIEFSTALDPIDGLLSPEAETSVYRIIQEGLNNVIKHAEASKGMVSLKRSAGELVISVSDNGKGIRKHQGEVLNGHGFGLADIAERARMLGGTSVIESAPEGGTKMTVTLKLSDLDKCRLS